VREVVRVVLIELLAKPQRAQACETERQQHNHNRNHNDNHNHNHNRNDTNIVVLSCFLPLLVAMAYVG
jgi:hypothetical protein